VPLPGAADDHQRKNARVVAEAGAAVMLEERDLSADALAKVAGHLLADRTRLAAMAREMHRFARPDAATRIVGRVLDLAGLESPKFEGRTSTLP